MLNFPTSIPACDTHSPALLDLFISYNPSIYYTVPFLSLGNSYHVTVSNIIDFISSWKGDVPSHRKTYENSRADWDSLCKHSRDVPWENVFNSASIAANEFCECFQVWIDVYIPYLKYQVRPHSSAWISAACVAVAIWNRNHFFFCTNRINLLYLKWSSDRLLIIVKGFLKMPNFLLLLKRKSLSLPRNVAQETFTKFLIKLSRMVNLLHLPYIMALHFYLQH